MSDKKWLLQRMPEATQNDIEFFIERVATNIYDARMDEMDARKCAYLNLLSKEEIK
jgi:hypothetical protein